MNASAPQAITHVDIKTVAAALGISKQATLKREKRESWEFNEQPARGGKKRLYPLSGLPTTIREAIQRLIDAQSGNYALDTGAANAYVVALSPAITAYGDGMTVRVKAVSANTGASTLNAGGGAVSLVNDAGGALAAGDIAAGSIFTATYIASANKFYITSLVQSQGDARYAALAGLATQTFSVAVPTAAVHALRGDSPQVVGFKNKVINGAMLIAQRATSATAVNSYKAVALDRWVTYFPNLSELTISQVSAVLSNFRYAVKVQRNAGVTTTNPGQIRCVIETSDAIPLQGKTVTLSFYAKAGANYSVAGGSLSSNIFTGTGTDESNANMGTWAGVVSAGQTNTLTTSWQRFSQTVTLGASVSEIGIVIGSGTFVGTAGADDSVYITGVQLEEGPFATAYDHRPVDLELRLCRRYLPSWTGNNNRAAGQAYSTTQAYIPIAFDTPARIPPTGLTVSDVAHFSLSRASSASDACSSVAFNSAGVHGCLVAAAEVGANLVAGNATLLLSTNSAAKILFDGCEL